MNISDIKIDSLDLIYRASEAYQYVTEIKTVLETINSLLV